MINQDLENLNLLIAEIKQLSDIGVNILIASKTITNNRLEKLIINGHKLFGENKIQEAENKWKELRIKYPDVKLHLIGHLQSNKVKEAFHLFDVIETLDSYKIAKKFADLEKENLKREYYIQVNIANEPQKYGMAAEELENFIIYTRELGLNVTGLMCIPPANDDPTFYFKLMKEYAHQFNLINISMGMSSDFRIAISHGATEIRIGELIFGKRGG